MSEQHETCDACGHAQEAHSEIEGGCVISWCQCRATFTPAIPCVSGGPPAPDAPKPSPEAFVAASKEHARQIDDFGCPVRLIRPSVLAAAYAVDAPRLRAVVPPPPDTATPPTTGWWDAYMAVETEVKASDADAKGRTVGEVLEARVRNAFAPLLRAPAPATDATTDFAAQLDAEHGAAAFARNHSAAPATDAPTADAHMIHGLERCIAAAHRLLDEHHDATVADRQDAEDAERLLAWLRGGATAPTPDHLMAIRRFLMNWVRPGNRVNAERELLNLLGLRRDTGASHE